MKIDDRKKPESVGHMLSYFNLGDCVRLAGDAMGSAMGTMYIVAAAGMQKRIAINLRNGCYRHEGRFVLEPDAKVVIG